jgi:hypothetical protein
VKFGDQSHCQVCRGRITLIHHPRIISLDTGLWVHTSLLRRIVGTHAAVGPA